MKKLLITGVMFLASLASAVDGKVGIPTTMDAMVTSSTNLGAAYTATGSQRLSSLKGLSNVVVYNGTSSNVAVAVRYNSCGASTNDNFPVPATTGIMVEHVTVGQVICLRSLTGSSISSGTIFTSAW